MARTKRNFPLPVETPPNVLLKHLDLIDDTGRLANAAILLFGKKPQKYFLTSEVKCAQFYGNVVEKPIPSYQIYRGTVFELVDQATSFVMQIRPPIKRITGIVAWHTIIEAHLDPVLPARIDEVAYNIALAILVVFEGCNIMFES